MVLARPAELSVTGWWVRSRATECGVDESLPPELCGKGWGKLMFNLQVMEAMESPHEISDNRKFILVAHMNRLE